MLQQRNRESRRQRHWLWNRRYFRKLLDHPQPMGNHLGTEGLHANGTWCQPMWSRCLGPGPTPWIIELPIGHNEILLLFDIG